MWLRKLSRRKCGWILAGVLVGGGVSYVLWPHPFRFLRGHRPVRPDARSSVYELSGDPVELSRRIDHELIAQGFKRLTDERWSKGRKVKYRSADEATRVFLVSEADPARPVCFWILTTRERPTLSLLVSEVRSLLTFTRRNYRGSPANACIANLKQIEGAQATWALENPRRTNEVPSDADLFGPQAYIRVKPECPEGGNYTRGNFGEHPHCSIPWHDFG